MKTTKIIGFFLLILFSIAILTSCGDSPTSPQYKTKLRNTGQRN